MERRSWRSAPWVLSIATCACGGAAKGLRSGCPQGQTNLDGTCVSHAIADYVACIRETGATLASDGTKVLSAAAGVAGVTASTQAEVQEKLEQSYAKVCVANALEIIRACHAKTVLNTAAVPTRAEGRPAIEGGVGLQVVAGTYGGNCGQGRGNVTTYLANACNGKANCVYTIDYTAIGDPAVGCAKDYVAEWRCGDDPTIYRASAPPEAGYRRTVDLVCGR